MLPNPPCGWFRAGFLALVVVAAVWWRPAAGPPPPPVVSVRELVAEPGAHLGREVVVIGEWVSSGPTAGGHMAVLLCGRGGGFVLCHFEDVAAADRGRLERYLPRTEEVVVCGRYDGVEDGRAVLRGCSLVE